MLRVKGTLEISISREGLNVDRLEEALAEAFRQFEKRVVGKVSEEIEKKILEEEQARVVKKGKRSRYLCTPLRWIRFSRGKP